MKKKSLLFCIVLSALMCCIMGCGQKNPLGVTKTTGKITLDNAPLADATVTFIPKTEGAGKRANGTTNSQGIYTITTQGAEGAIGAVPGEYYVTVTKNVPEVIEAASEEDKSSSTAPPKIIKHVADKFGKPETSDLSATVVAGKANEFNFTVEK